MGDDSCYFFLILVKLFGGIKAIIFEVVFFFSGGFYKSEAGNLVSSS